MDATGGWTDEHVLALGDAASITALAGPMSWRSVGCDDDAVWGECLGADPRASDRAYEVLIDLRPLDVESADRRRSGRVATTAVRTRCTCPSRKRPCKHALALLLRYGRGEVPPAGRPEDVERALAGTRPSGGARPGPVRGGRPPSDDSSDETRGRPDRSTPGREGDDRIARTAAGLADLERWLEDRMRTGLADPVLARYETWDRLAARLVDAGAGALAGRVRRIAGLVGAGPDWHGRVLAELGNLHLLASGGLRYPALPDDLAGVLGVAIGRQVRRADVLAGVPETDDWFVAGRSDEREDRIVVRRWWLRGRRSGRWSMVLSFAAYGEALDDGFEVGETRRADVHRYPGRSIRVLVVPPADEHSVERPVEQEPLADRLPTPATTIAEACASIGAVVAAEPWIERVPVTVVAAPAPTSRGWYLTDGTGSLPLVGVDTSLAGLLAASRGLPVPTTVEWTPWGLRPVAVHLADRSVDLGPHVGRPESVRAVVSGSDSTGSELGLERYWNDLVAVAVLGTERRDPPAPPAGALADLIADASVEGADRRPVDGAARLLVAVAATTAVRRGAFLPAPPADPIVRPEDDERPWCSPAAVSTWRTIVRDWPVLEDEWLDALDASGLAAPPDLVVELLGRHRAAADRGGRVERAVGPLAAWLVDLVPSLAASGARRPPAGPDVPMPADLARLATAPDGVLVAGLREVLETPSTPSSRGPFLAQLLVRCRREVLGDVAALLDQVGHPLAELADLRRRMLAELDASWPSSAPG
ncbi:MAG: hypothetical protein RLZZ01_2011 [Actinomycetota bacterium]